MRISDETLSAFLDNELTASEMEKVKDAMLEMPELAERLAELTMADEQVKAHASEIDKHPLPKRTLALLNDSEDTSNSNWWRRTGTRMSKVAAEQMAVAASIFVLLGGVAGYWLATPDTTEDSWQLVQQQLSSAPSGSSFELADGQVFTSQFSFSDANGDLCRVYQLQGSQRSENIACWQADTGWQNQLTVYASSTTEGEYSLASGSALMQQQVTAMQAGSVYSLEQEQAALEHLLENHSKN